MRGWWFWQRVSMQTWAGCKQCLQTSHCKQHKPEVCSSPEQRGLSVSTETPLLIYSFYFLDDIWNLLSRKCDFGCLISTANIIKGNTKAAENTWLPCLELDQCCAGLIREASGMNTFHSPFSNSAPPLISTCLTSNVQFHQSWRFIKQTSAETTVRGDGGAWLAAVSH